MGWSSGERGGRIDRGLDLCGGKKNISSPQSQQKKGECHCERTSGFRMTSIDTKTKSRKMKNWSTRPARRDANVAGIAGGIDVCQLKAAEQAEIRGSGASAGGRT